MKGRDLSELLALAALWGASFLFMRLGAAEFGPVAFAAQRGIGATQCLLPLLALQGGLPELKKHWRPLAIVGLLNSAFPFLCYSYAALQLNGGLMSIFNAATPLMGAAVAWLWLKDQPTRWRLAGLGIGFVGVIGLAWQKAHAPLAASGNTGSAAWAIAACLAATLFYGISASYTKRYLTGVPALAVATGSQVSAALALTLPMLWTWPSAAPSLGAWGAVLGLAVLCTGMAYVLFFRLIAHIGPANAISVTFLIPAFAVVWGAIFLHEMPTTAMGVGALVILLGTALATGLLPRPKR